ncbi:hypothetical protein ES288_D05G204300v1 [Gossypium darwinii]|uniref:Kinesin motor domain-containing protein n=1 Tax=Gossypium darwinii TaxID=34276 RepID=A0A5D2CLN2_GOSDA|nr:hypothetical protein ES288_D05G204300v1 [Gossypium darwinii]
MISPLTFRFSPKIQIIFIFRHLCLNSESGERSAMETNTTTPCSSSVTVRRNPRRKARDTSLFSTSRLPSQSTSSSDLPQISSFPFQDILSEKIQQNSPTIITATSPSPPQHSVLENLKVYLRIRPLVPLKGSTKNAGEQYAKSRQKNVWPQNLSKKNSVKEKKISKKKSNESCITVSEDFRSVTLLPPPPLQETKRIKSEVFEGFSYVFSAESTQSEVFEKMVNPLVEDFLGGKSGMLAALGPTGSGKTHTVFGSPREPGMVPLTLKRIFKSAQGCDSQSSRRFYLSIFEICAERGKVERICFLSSDKPDLSTQQSAIKGLLEVPIHDVAEAELLIARALLKRSTATTNANSQSSRSQCIINIRGGSEIADVETDEQSNSAVLSIVDLAGAEREKRTGNQGARLAESNFINNTSMVFGLCLRSLFEHQKNPKKALQKHFQNSLLTRYLRDYLEGKKRMTLILTVKSGEDDYIDASYLLRQASPYMKIQFTNIEPQPNLLCNKRQLQTTSKAEQSKRMKLGNFDASMMERKIVGHENRLPDEGDLTSCSADLKSSTPLKLNSDDLKKERTHQIMQSFAKALWNILKQYNEKLKVAESENQILRENLRNEKKRSIEMEKELKNLRSCCTCSKDNLVASTIVKVVENFESMVHSEQQTSCGIDEEKLDLNSSDHIKSECSSSPRKFECTPGEDQRNKKCTGEKGNPSPSQKQDMCSEVLNQNIPSNLSGPEYIDEEQEHEAMVRSLETDASFPSTCVPNDNYQSSQIHESSPGTGNIHKDLSELNNVVTERLDHNSCITGVAVRNSSNESSTSVQPGCQLGENDEISDVEPTQKQDHVDVPDSGIRPNISCNSSKKEKPKRRLLPKSSVLVREISTYDADEFDKTKGSGGEKNLAASERQRTQGSISLLRLLKSNLHL